MAAVAEVFGIRSHKLRLNFPTLGNIGPAALPITLAMAEEAGRIKAGDHVALLGNNKPVLRTCELTLRFSSSSFKCVSDLRVFDRIRPRIIFPS